jgi:DNA modification methylase
MQELEETSQVYYKTVPISTLLYHPQNYKEHPDRQIAGLKSSLLRFGQVKPVVVQKVAGQEEYIVLAGHGLTMAARALIDEYPDRERIQHWAKQWAIAVVPISWTAAEAKAYLVADNELARAAITDEAALAELLQEQKDLGLDLESLGFSDEEFEELLQRLDEQTSEEDIEAWEKREVAAKLNERFIVPPFSVLDARQGYWAERKKAWNALGIKSRLGRADTLLSPSLRNLSAKKAKFSQKTVEERAITGTSTFDPVLCELVYRWFCPPGGQVLDPFAGGSVRGVVASYLERAYTGVDLRPEQCEENESQAREIFGKNHEPMPHWIAGDSRQVIPQLDIAADLVFTCPPYYDLEVYSDDPSDISNTGSYEAFIELYSAILAEAIAKLREDRFVCVVVGDIRDKNGHYRNFVADTVEACERAGAHYYNEGILVTPYNTLALRAGGQFVASRKLGKTHQNVLNFVKGDWRRAVAACGEIEVELPEPDEE